jgi:SAM-dependent methyltransferase
MSVDSIIENDLVEDASSVWLLRGHNTFDYTDGPASEQYLEKVFRSATDLSSRSAELESHMKDWSSEYHLTRKRGQLLSGFKFDRSLKVLEVGCGCGAITRHLGETFDNVVSVEGSISRARLARLRTRDLPSVSIVCAPFQEIKFTTKFDIIFVIGVFEYSAAFVADDDPYDAALRYFVNILSPNGLVVIAIENQFGLKYLTGVREDHLGTRFEGVEGYHRRKAGVRTFGKPELMGYVRRYFEDVQFYYPYPDYKIPDCVLSDDFLRSGRAGEVVSQMTSRDYSGLNTPLWDEATTQLELSRNGMLDFFANSFLVVAARRQITGADFDQAAVLYSANRTIKFSTETRVFKDASDRWSVTKRVLPYGGTVDGGAVRLVNSDAPWINNFSVLTRVNLLAKSRSVAFAKIFAPCGAWLALLKNESFEQNGVVFVDGSHIDTLWGNVYGEGDDLRIVDREWIWQRPIPLNILVIRAIYDFLQRSAKSAGTDRVFQSRSGRSSIVAIAQTLGVKLTQDDFDGFITMESEFQWIVCGLDKDRQHLYWRWFLRDRRSLKTAVQGLRWLQFYRDRAASALPRLLARLKRAR